MAWQGDLTIDVLEEFAEHISHDEEWRHWAAVTDTRRERWKRSAKRHYARMSEDPVAWGEHLAARRAKRLAPPDSQLRLDTGPEPERESGRYAVKRERRVEAAPTAVQRSLFGKVG